MIKCDVIYPNASKDVTCQSNIAKTAIKAARISFALQFSAGAVKFSFLSLILDGIGYGVT